MLYKVNQYILSTHKTVIFNFRRDKESCHECRFCCTLSICTTKENTYFKEGIDETTDKEDSVNGVTAKTGFLVDMKMWKYYDFRCLKPVEGKESEVWPHYEMAGFRAAKSKQELDRVKEIKFDKYFFNMEDPDIFDAFTTKNKAYKFWKRTYGFDYATLVEGKNAKGNFSKCLMRCLKAEESKFAVNCRHTGGFFKCCTIG